jgi:hypothetical protein
VEKYSKKAMEKGPQYRGKGLKAFNERRGGEGV